MSGEFDKPKPASIGEDGPETVSKPAPGHEHRWQRFRNLGEARKPSDSPMVEMCGGCGKTRKARD